MEKVSYRTALRHIIAAGSQIMAATFVKTDGSIRDMTFRRNVATQVKSNPNNNPNDSRLRVKRGSLVTVVEMDGSSERKWKTVNLRTMSRLKIGKKEYFISE